MKKILAISALICTSYIVPMEIVQKNQLPEPTHRKEEDTALKTLVEERIITKQDLNKKLENEWACPLHRAALKDANLFSITLLLLAKEARTDVVSPENCTPLHIATESLALNTVPVLLAFRANPNAQRSFELQTPLHVICSPRLDSLHQENINLRYKITLALLQFANPNARNSYGRTPIYSLACYCYQDDDSVQTKCQTPDDFDCFYRQRESLMSLLIRHGLNLNEKDNSGKTVIQLAQERVVAQAQVGPDRGLTRFVEFLEEQQKIKK